MSSELASSKAPEGWADTTWGELIELSYGKALGNRKNSAGIAEVFGTNGPTGDHSSEAQGSGPTIVIGRKGAYRGVRWAPGPFWVIDTAFYVRPKTEMDLAWAFRALSTVDIDGLDSGSAIPSTRREDVYGVSVALPPLDEQRRIAWVLDSLDEKIKHNQRIARTLEEIAATLFKTRFVDFVDHGDLVESEIGLIPRGWKVAPIAEVGRVQRDLIDGSSGLPYIGLDRMPKGSTVLTDWQTDDAPTGQSAKFAEDDILFGKLRPYFRKVGVAPIEGRCSTEILVLRPSDVAYHGFLLGHVSSQRFIDHCVAVSRGTRMPRSEWKDAGTFPVAVPPRDVAAALNVVMATMYGRIRASVHESRTLASVRDALLPRLISSQIRVPATDAEESLA